ncbi:MAG: hypothetical protein EOP66_05025 [Sphingomonas sp.]|nr:MAG: hypothetical protein EOP66_05025 [Sphingomonas sp.]
MMRFWTMMGVGAAAFVCIGSRAVAQDFYYWPMPETARQAADATYFPMGTPVKLRTRTQVSTKSNKPGDRLYLEVAEDLVYRGQVVIPAGAVATAEVARADRNGHFGRKGKLNIQLLHVQTAAGPVRLTGNSYDEGTTGLYTSIATMVFVSPLGFLVHGTSAQIPQGSIVQAYLAEPMRFFQKSTTPQSVNWVEPDDVRRVPARFDSTVVAGAGFQPSTR